MNPSLLCDVIGVDLSISLGGHCVLVQIKGSLGRVRLSKLSFSPGRPVLVSFHAILSSNNLI